jgi:hypothetical protein
MPDLHDVLDRRASRHQPAPDLFERVRRRHQQRDRNRRISAAVVALLVTAAAFGAPLWGVRSGVIAGSGGGTSGSMSSPPPTPPNQNEAVAIDPGEYRVVRDPSSSVMPYTVTLPEGWAVQYGFMFSTHQEKVGFYATSVQRVFADTCKGSEGDVVKIGAGVDDLARALLEQAGPQASGPVETTLGGYPASRVDLTVPARSAGKRCTVGRGIQQLWVAKPKEYTVLFPDSTASVFIVDVNGQRQVFFTQQWKGASDQDRQELQAALDSIRFET